MATIAALSLYLWGAGAALATGEVTLGGPFHLIDQDGKPRTEADFRGSYELIYFGFTHCPDLCPRSLGTMTAALDELEQRDRKSTRLNSSHIQKSRMPSSA